MYKKFLIILLNILMLINNSQTFAKYISNYTLDVATIDTGGNYYLIKYTGKDSPNKKIEKVYKGDDHDPNGEILKQWIINKRHVLETIKIEDNSGDIRDCSYLFGGSSEIPLCQHLKKIDLSGFNTENVTDMAFMFYECINLVELDISNLNTSKVTEMSYMFANCYSLETIDLMSFDTCNVKYMIYTFGNCRETKEIKVSKKWITDNVDTSDMFKYCGVTSVSLYN